MSIGYHKENLTQGRTKGTGVYIHVKKVKLDEYVKICWCYEKQWRVEGCLNVIWLCCLTGKPGTLSQNYSK